MGETERSGKPMNKEVIVITGGAGFIGSNLANLFLADGARVRIFDNLARRGVEQNLQWLQATYPDQVEFMRGDIRNPVEVEHALKDAGIVYHFASQVAVTTSVAAPRYDFEVNALGTLNVLEAARKLPEPPIILFTSTNKVYGNLSTLPVREGSTRYEFADHKSGVSEGQSTDFHSPYGCSKGAADQYMRDYHRIYGIPTVVFRMSCIYGVRQHGTEDQGWVAHFVRAALLNQPITIYGNGKQVRDILWIGDLVQAMRAAVAAIDITAGQIYNIGGGPQNTISIWVEFAEILTRLIGKEIPVDRQGWRPGDQLIYVSDTAKAFRDFGWRPTTSAEEGIGQLFRWMQANLAGQVRANAA